MRPRVIEFKNEKICTTLEQLYIFICKHISFQAKFCMLIVISLKNIEKFFLYLNVHMSTLKWGQRSSSAIMGAFLQTLFLFSLVKQQDVFKV